MSIESEKNLPKRSWEGEFDQGEYIQGLMDDCYEAMLREVKDRDSWYNVGYSASLILGVSLDRCFKLDNYSRPVVNLPEKGDLKPNIRLLLYAEFLCGLDKVASDIKFRERQLGESLSKVNRSSLLEGIAEVCTPRDFYTETGRKSASLSLYEELVETITEKDLCDRDGSRDEDTLDSLMSTYRAYKTIKELGLEE